VQGVHLKEVTEMAKDGDSRAVRHLSEGIARREFFRRTGRLAFVATVGSWVMGVSRAEAHPPGTCLSESHHCGFFGCDCRGTNCVRPNGNPCANRVGDCPGGGQCWTETCQGNRLRCCDYFCSGSRCHCCRRL
jgi:hypothetical protein